VELIVGRQTGCEDVTGFGVLADGALSRGNNTLAVPAGGILCSLVVHKSGPRYQLFPAPHLQVACLLTDHLQCLPLSAGWGPPPGGASPTTRTLIVTSSWPRLFVW
jgi:hypothetical protein